MDTSPLSPRQQFREMVATVAAKAKAILPEQTNGRVESACKLVLQGDVEPQADGTIWVGSSDPARVYTLEGTKCTCTDFSQGKAPQGWCKHRIAAGIAKRVGEMLVALPAPPIAAPTTPLPEAPASCNVYVTISGHKVQVTLRDSDEGRMLDRLQVLLDRYPALAPATDDTRQCPVHQVPMRQTTKDGRSWYSHRTDQGWCKGKGVQP
jgi:hypothetical protein